MSATIQEAGGRVVEAQAHTICRCGFSIEIGHVVVDIDGLMVRVGIDAKGVQWPPGVQVTRARASILGPIIRRAWLQAVGAEWDTAPDARAKGA
jgi:hypothetical protein